MNELPSILSDVSASRRTVVEGLEIHYYDWGKPGAATVLVHVHGWAANGIEALPMAEQLLADGMDVRVIALDLPGCGFSQRPNPSLGMNGYVNFVPSWIAHIGSDLLIDPTARIVLWAHSMGAHICLNSLLRFRFDSSPAPAQKDDSRRAAMARIDRLILCAPDGMEGEEGPLLLLRNRTLMHLAKPFFARWMFNLAAKIRVYFDIRSCPRIVLDVEWESLLYQKGLDSVIEITMDTLATQCLNGRLFGIALPVLMVWGRQDNVLSHQYSAHFIRELPDLRFFDFDQCGHVPHIEKCREVATRIKDFL